MCNDCAPRLSRFFDIANCEIKRGTSVTLSFEGCSACRVATPISKSLEYLQDLHPDETIRVRSEIDKKGFILGS